MLYLLYAYQLKDFLFIERFVSTSHTKVNTLQMKTSSYHLNYCLNQQQINVLLYYLNKLHISNSRLYL